MCKSETYRGKNNGENMLLGLVFSLLSTTGKQTGIAVSNNQKDMKCMLVLS